MKNRSATYDRGLDRRVAEAFGSKELYFEMLHRWHDQKGGIAVESDVQRLIEKFTERAKLVLEAGCGAGDIINWFAQKYPDTRFVGVDISPIGVRLSQKGAPRNACFTVADLKHLSFPSDTFDFVFSQSVLEHVVGWEVALAELHRIIRPGGHLLIRLHNAGVDGKPLRRAFIDYLLRRNRAQPLNPSFDLSSGSDWNGHMTNYDVQGIPSDVLVRALRRRGFSTSYFTTGANRWRQSANSMARLISCLPFWPFSHLGYTTIVLARKS